MVIDKANKHLDEISRGTDHLGFLSNTLRGLRGSATLICELIQNADDAPEATEISFDVRREGLVVDNDGFFSDCGHAKNEENRCPWEETKNYRCDFHRFRSVACGDKREQVGTIGAFGIGFTAVYQVTDRPELISAGQHWIVREEKREEGRIGVCRGCEVCTDPTLPRTRFILPWASDSNNIIRKKLRVEPVTEASIGELLGELGRSLPTAMLFLTKIVLIEVKRDAHVIHRFERIKEGNSIIVSDGRENPVWTLYQGSFSEKARDLRRQHPSRIEDKRSDCITLAIPDHHIESGLFSAFLPTQYETGLPFHINADFFTTSDRKYLIFESEYQSEWNRAAVRASAETLCDNLIEIRDLLDHKRLWKMISVIQRIAQEAGEGQRDRSLAEFWELLMPKLADSPIIFDTLGNWRMASEVLLLERKEERAAIPVLEGLDLPLVHINLMSYQALLTSKEAVGVQLLNIGHIASALKKQGLIKRIDFNDLPLILRDKSALSILWTEIAILLEQLRRRGSKEEKENSKSELRECAIALGHDGALWPCREIYQADPETFDLFTSIDSKIPFLAELEEEAEILGTLCSRFFAKVAIGFLEKLTASEFSSAWEDGKFNPARLLDWFQHRRQELTSQELKHELAALPIFPSATGLHPLSELSLPGDFKDPVGLAELVDLDHLDDKREFLKSLGARELTFQEYVTNHVPKAFCDETVRAETKREVVRLLSNKLGEILGSSDIEDVLLDLKIVECDDGSWCRPDEAYLPSAVIREVVGAKMKLARVPEGHTEATYELYRWLKVAEKPRYADIVKRIRELTIVAPTPESLDAISSIFKHLGERLKEENGAEPEELNELKTICWLPAKNNLTLWFPPEELRSVFEEHLFQSRGRFLSVPFATQSKSIALLDFLDIKSSPEVFQVVAHLLYCSEKRESVSKAVYRFLDDNSEHESLAQLRDKPCLLVHDENRNEDVFVRPNQVYWSKHSFGRFRKALDTELRIYGHLFTRLGVKDTPLNPDALDVIRDIATEFGSVNNELDKEAYSVLLECWKMLEDALQDGQISTEELADLIDTKAIPDDRNLLVPPKLMFFEDRAGLAAEFDEYLKHNVIPRLEGAWCAMAAAGVRPLSEVVETHIVDRPDPVVDELISRRIRERRLELIRVVESHKPGLDISAIEKLDCHSVQKLKIQHSLKALGPEWRGKPKPVQAHFHREDNLLLFIRRDGEYPWTFIARELTLAMCPDIEPGLLAPGIKEVLSAKSEEEARSILDELGFSPMREAPESGVTAGMSVVGLGGAEAPEHAAPIATLIDSPEGPGPAGAQPPTTEGAIGSILGSEVPPPSTPPEEIIEGSREKQGRLLSYVFYGDKESVGEDPEKAKQRTAVDQAGVDRVMEYELQQGRIPEEMPPKHPGYDIKSKNDNGKIIRYIEVKSMSGYWGRTGTGMTNTQFDRARKEKELFWLYVVERTEQDDWKIYRIQNPARRVNRYFYDHNWRALAEEDGKVEENEEEVTQ